MDGPEDIVDMAQYFGSAVDATMDIWRNSIAKEFNSTLTQFVTKLQKAYRAIPEMKTEIDIRSAIIDKIASKDAHFFVDHFYRVAAPHITEGTLDEWKREDFMDKVLPHIKLLQSFHITDYWDKTPERTRESVWQYVQKMWRLSHDYNNQVDKAQLSAQAMDLLKQPAFHEMMKKMTGGL